MLILVFRKNKSKLSKRPPFQSGMKPDYLFSIEHSARHYAECFFIRHIMRHYIQGLGIEHRAQHCVGGIFKSNFF